jgi:pinin
LEVLSAGIQSFHLFNNSIKDYFFFFNSLRVAERSLDDDNETPVRKPTLQSSVVATPREVKPRTQALEEQKNDKKSLARNKRMFGMILGTLQKFQSEESMRKDTV